MLKYCHYFIDPYDSDDQTMDETIQNQGSNKKRNVGGMYSSRPIYRFCILLKNCPHHQSLKMKFILN